MLNVCCQKQLKSVVRGTSLPDRSPEGGAVKDYRCVPASEEGRKQLDVVLEEFNAIRSMLGVPSLAAQQYPIDLSSRQCIMITKFPGSRFIVGYIILLRKLQVHWLCVTTLGV